MSQTSENLSTDGLDERTLKQRMASRKFILACGILVTATILLIKGFVSGDNWVDVSGIVGVGYIVGQAWQNRR